MLHHPVILIPKLILLAGLAAVLFVLHGILPPSQFKVAVVVAAFLFLVGMVVIWVVAAKLLSDPNSKAARATVLSNAVRSEDGFRASPDAFTHLVGKQGIAVSNLNPSGNADIDGRRVSVVADAEFVDEGTRVEVVRVQGAKIVVRSLH